MITYKLKIKNRINVSEYCENYSWMFRKLYSNFELSEDKGFQKELRKKYNLDSWFYETCRIEVSTKLSQDETQRKKKANKITELENLLAKNEFTGLKGKRNKFKIMQKLNYLKSNADKKIIFGTKALLRKISFLPNHIKALRVI